MGGVGSDSERIQRTLRIRCGCASETAMLIGDAEHFSSELRVAKAAVGSSRPWRELENGDLFCTRCEQVIEITPKPRVSDDPEST
jgi:hypothetical protein